MPDMQKKLSVRLSDTQYSQWVNLGLNSSHLRLAMERFIQALPKDSADDREALESAK